MRRISTSTKVTDKFGAGKHGFTNGNAVGGIPATDLEDVWFDHIQEEAAGVIEAAGIVLDPNNRAQLLAALQKFIQAGSMVTGNDTGAANVYAVAFAPAIAALTDGMELRFKAANANTGASTLNVNGLGAQPIVGLGHQPLQGGEIVAGWCQVVWRAAINSWVLIRCTGGALQVAAPTQSNHAVNRAAGDTRYAALAGLATQAFDVGAPTNGASAVNLNEFFSSLTQNGCIKIPVIAGGIKRTLIIQWGQANSVPAGGGVNVTFPIAFPNAFLMAVASFVNSGGLTTASAGGWGIQGLTGMTVFNNGNGGASAISYIAIGW
ncbi:hypothetical protein [Cupriavidus taiwanensis]|uniref:gp53-like domain-containing protein n=1 Tax=Cupriavidus taiwanensis TaxID=164546 RepID=UPI0039C08D1F